MEKMNVLVIDAYGDFRYEEIEKPQAGPEEVVVKIGAAGICAADLKMYSQTEGPWPLNFPVISGHEFVGTVVELGEGAAEKFGLSIGDNTTAELIVPSRKCYYCKNGMYHHCINAVYLCIHDHGGMAEYMRFPLAIKYIAEGKINARKMGTHQFPLRDFKKAMETKKKKTDEPVIKVILIR